MANGDIVVSTEQGTILDYFGVANTYDPFTNQHKLQEVKDLDFNIPELPPFDLAEFVAVSTGLLATSLSFLNYCEFSILDKETGEKIIDLKNNVGEIGNNSFYPAENQIFWFNREGLRGTFYLNKVHAGKVLHITTGMFSTTSITSGVLRDMFERTTGVPKYIQDINKALESIRYVPYNKSASGGSSASLWIPDRFIGYVEVSGSVTTYNTAGYCYASILASYNSMHGGMMMAYDWDMGSSYRYKTGDLGDSSMETGYNYVSCGVSVSNVRVPVAMGSTMYVFAKASSIWRANMSAICRGYTIEL